jgi:hypothetical protein
MTVVPLMGYDKTKKIYVGGGDSIEFELKNEYVVAAHCITSS